MLLLLRMVTMDAAAHKNLRRHYPDMGVKRVKLVHRRGVTVVVLVVVEEREETVGLVGLEVG